MSPSPVVQRHPALRWIVPVLAVATMGGGATLLSSSDSPTAGLPDTTVTALITSIRTADAADGQAFSGTVVSTLAVGDDADPDIDPRPADTSLLAVTSLLAGTHTLQVWASDGGRRRVDVVDDDAEIDLVQQGRSVWRWDVARRLATNTVMPAAAPSPNTTAATRTQTLLPSLAEIDSLTPAGLSSRALAWATSTTRSTLGAPHEIAGRRVYELILVPDDTASRVGSVRIAVDGATRLPLAVSVFARGAVAPEVSVAFTSIRLGRPADTVFRFTAPSDATVQRAGSAAPSAPATSAPATSAPATSAPVTSAGAMSAGLAPVEARTAVFGSGWSSVLGYRGPAVFRLRTTAFGHGDGAVSVDSAQVTGRWGSGYLVESPLLSVLVVDDGRAYAGPVDPDALYAAAALPAGSTNRP